MLSRPKSCNRWASLRLIRAFTDHNNVEIAAREYWLTAINGYTAGFQPLVSTVIAA